MGISRRKLVTAAAGGVAGLAFGAWAPSILEFRSPGRRYGDIVLIVADAMRADKIGKVVNGIEVTPNLNRLAAESAFFTSAFSCAPNTKPSMASIMTGHYPPYHGVEYGSYTIPPNVETIASFLSARGYTTVGIQTNPWLEGERDAMRGMGRRAGFGFNEHFTIYRYEDIDWGKTAVLGRGLAYAPIERVNESLGRIFTNQIAALASDGPLFVYLHFMDTHQPWIRSEPTEFTGRFHPPEIAGGAGGDEILAREAEVVKSVLFDDRGESVPSDEWRAIVEAINDEAAALLDSRFGETLRLLRRRNRACTVIFTADHGDEIYEHGKLGHGKNLYNPVLHVPLLISGGDIGANRLDMRAPNSAIFATIRDWFGEGEREDAVLGSLMPYISGGESRHHPIFASHKGARKMILSDGRTAIDEKGKVLLFEVNSDPGEKSPVVAEAGSGERPAAVYELAKILRVIEGSRVADGVKRTLSTHQWQNIDAVGGTEYETVSAEEIEDLTEERKEQLRALGYLQ
ncbi:MAG: sulfatase-like hydrolase/transferase [Planctomycetota bacterium]|jgi:arylsulfatase A-like enzyme